MTRATETTEIISKHLPGVKKISTDLLREGAPIEPDPPVSHWKPEAVQYYEDGARIEAAFRNFIHRADAKQEEDSYEIFVCHANVIRYIVCRALQFPPEGWLRMSLNNGSITHLVIRPNGRVALRTLGDTGFMPPDKITRTWMSETDGWPGAAASLFALVHSAAVPLDYLLCWVGVWCCLKKCPLAPRLLHTYSYLPFSPEKKKSL